jgi:hypothetical protein
MIENLRSLPELDPLTKPYPFGMLFQDPGEYIVTGWMNDNRPTNPFGLESESVIVQGQWTEDDCAEDCDKDCDDDSDGYVDDVYCFALPDVDLTVSPASEDPSEPGMSIRVEGKDVVSGPIYHIGISDNGRGYIDETHRFEVDEDTTDDPVPFESTFSCQAHLDDLPDFVSTICTDDDGNIVDADTLPAYVPVTNWRHRPLFRRVRATLDTPGEHDITYRWDGDWDSLHVDGDLAFPPTDTEQRLIDQLRQTIRASNDPSCPGRDHNHDDQGTIIVWGATSETTFTVEDDDQSPDDKAILGWNPLEST